MTAHLATTDSEHDAYALCSQVTRTQARNFYYGIRLLPPTKRQALCALYALARRVDDIGDGDQPAPVKLAELAAVRAELASIDSSSDPVLVAVGAVARRMPVPLAAFEDLVDGVEMDVLGTRYETFDDLVLYCRRVAGSIGQLCLAVFGTRTGPGTSRGGDGSAARHSVDQPIAAHSVDQPIASHSVDQPIASQYADALGVALQQTNILRDIREDLTTGRVYLPQEDLDRFGVRLRLDERGNLVDDGSLSALIRFSADRARTWYAEGLRLVPLLDRRSAACCSAMAGIYRRLLEQIAADPRSVLDRRLSLSGWQKAGVAASALAGLS